jgi:glycosyltransferase involved in cell wall biosynthesis
MATNKILFIRNAYENIGGVDRQILRIARELNKRGLFVPVLATTNKNLPFSKEFKNAGFVVHEIPLGNNISIFKSAFSIKALLENDRTIVAIQTHLLRESFVGRITKFLNNNKVVHIFRAQTYIDCSNIPFWKKWIYHLTDKMTSFYVDRYIANGKILADEIIQKSWISCNKISVVINGCEQIGEVDQSPSNKEKPLSPQIAMIANYLPKKGHDVLIKSLAILKDRGVCINARLIGADIESTTECNGVPFSAVIKMEAQKYAVLDQLEFYGFSKNIPSALMGFQVVVLPSDSEGVPNCILEAMSIRKLVIASNVGGVSQIIEHDFNGLLHPPQDPGAFSEILYNVFTTPAQKWETLRNSAYKTWQTSFSLEKMIDKLTAVYKEIDLLK